MTVGKVPPLSPLVSGGRLFALWLLMQNLIDEDSKCGVPLSGRRTILVTGGTGFIGQALLHHLLRLDEHPLALVRDSAADLPVGTERILGDLSAPTLPLAGVDTIVHCAARVHIMRETVGDPLSLFRQVNVEGTLNLARRAVAAGVRRFVFVSSIKVNGEETAPGRPFTAAQVPVPADAYGLSKLEAEQALLALAAETGLEVVIVRPVLVYGPGVKANFRRMMMWLHSGVPLPLGGVDNRRSLLALDNLVDLLDCCIDHPAAAGRIFLASDNEDLSTAELLRRLALAMGVAPRLLPVPAGWLRSGARLLGREDIARRLCSSLQVDMSETRQVLKWSPPVSVDDALRKTAHAFMENYRQ